MSWSIVSNAALRSSKTSKNKKKLSCSSEVLNSSPRAPRSAYLACLSLLTHLIQIISLLEVPSMHELCSDWHAPYTGSIAPYSLSRGNPLKFTLFRNIYSWICATQRLHVRTSVTSYTSVNIYNFNSRLAHLYALWMECIHGGISCDVHFAGHLRSNRTNIWSDKSNIRNMQSGGGVRGLELRTAAVAQLVEHGASNAKVMGSIQSWFSWVHQQITPSASVRNLGVIFDDQLTFKAHIAKTATTGSAPSYFHSLLRIYIPSRILRSASEQRLVVPSQRGSKSLSRTFSFTVPGWWNDLPTPIRNAGSLSIFKQQLKTHLFQHYLTSS